VCVCMRVCLHCACICACVCMYMYVCIANIYVFLRMCVREGCIKWLGQLIPLFAAERRDEYFSVGLIICSAETSKITLTVCSSS
jgi:hypothetical protein